jgi:hypothetical protein
MVLLVPKMNTPLLRPFWPLFEIVEFAMLTELLLRTLTPSAKLDDIVLFGPIVILLTPLRKIPEPPLLLLIVEAAR